jgi:hypothetical protein
MPYAATLTSVRASVNTSPSGSAIITDIHKNGTTILSTKINIDQNDRTSLTSTTPPVISVPSIADDDELTINIDQVGSVGAGKGLKVVMKGTKV